MSVNRHNRPKMELKSEENGVVYEIKYTGNVVILTKEEYSRLKGKARRFDQEKKSWSKEREGYELEIQRLKNEIAEIERRRSEKARREKALELGKNPSQEDFNAKAEALAEQMAQGRPRKLLDKHKAFLRAAVEQEAREGKAYPIGYFYAQLVNKFRYPGGAEPVRKYLKVLRDEQEALRAMALGSALREANEPSKSDTQG